MNKKNSKIIRDVGGLHPHMARNPRFLVKEFLVVPSDIGDITISLKQSVGAKSGDRYSKSMVKMTRSR